MLRCGLCELPNLSLRRTSAFPGAQALDEHRAEAGVARLDGVLERGQHGHVPVRKAGGVAAVGLHMESVEVLVAGARLRILTTSAVASSMWEGSSTVTVFPFLAGWVRCEDDPGAPELELDPGSAGDAERLARVRSVGQESHIGLTLARHGVERAEADRKGVQ